MKILLVLVVVVALTGCATAPKPDMPEQKYAQLAGHYVGTQKCGVLGHMSPELAALGTQYIKAEMYQFTFDSERMETKARELEPKIHPTVAECNTVAMKIHEVRRQIDQNNAVTAENQKAWADVIKQTTPTRTYCNKIGTQILCSTY